MPKGIYEHTKQGRSGLRRINGKDVKNWITLPNGKHVVLGKGELTDYAFPYTHKKPYTDSDNLKFKAGDDEMIYLYEYLNSAKLQKQKEAQAKENEEDEKYSYSCPDCGNKIKKSDKRCSNCKVIIDWE